MPDTVAAVQLANAIAPEHLEMATEDASLLAKRVTTAGCVFVGEGGATAFGDYAAGSNHVLPTGGAGRFQGPLGPGAFRRRITTVELTQDGGPGARSGGRYIWPAPRASRCTRSPRRHGRRRDSMSRTAEINRETKETKVRLRLDLDGGEAKISTGVGFLDHMLELLARHGRLGLELEASGDLETGAHHTTEDVGICLGQAIDEALGDRAGIRRYGSALVPMDEALGECAIDISGRPYCAFDAELPDVTIAGFDSELAEEFFRAVSNNSKITLHLWVRSGSNAHHMIEASFKAFARALREAVSIDPDETGVPSTKGTLTE